MKRITTILLIAGIAFFSLFFFVEKSFASPAYLLGRVALQSNSTGSFYQGVYYYGTGCDSGDGNPGPGEGYGSPNFNVSWKYTWDTNWQATINSGNSFSNCYGGEFLPRPRFTFEDTPIGATFDGIKIRYIGASLPEKVITGSLRVPYSHRFDKDGKCPKCGTKMSLVL